MSRFLAQANWVNGQYCLRRWKKKPKQTDEQSPEGETVKTHLSMLSPRCLLDIHVETRKGS